MTEPQQPSEPTPTPDQPDTGTPAPAASTDSANETEKWQALAKKHEARAKENAKAAEELAALKQSQMTEAERTAARIVELERETNAAKAEALRFRIATRHGISDEDAELFLTATDEETLERQAAALAARSAAAAAATSTAPAGPRPDLSQGARDATLALNSDELTEKLARAVGARR